MKASLCGGGGDGLEHQRGRVVAARRHCRRWTVRGSDARVFVALVARVLVNE